MQTIRKSGIYNIKNENKTEVFDTELKKLIYKVKSTKIGNIFKGIWYCEKNFYLKYIDDVNLFSTKDDLYSNLTEKINFRPHQMKYPIAVQCEDFKLFIEKFKGK